MAMNKLPDIDIDFAHDRKDDVVELIFEKYGRNMRGGGRLLDLPGPERLCGGRQSAGCGRAGSPQIHGSFSVGLRRRLGAGRTDVRHWRCG